MRKCYEHITERVIVAQTNVLRCEQRHESQEHEANEKDESQRAARSETFSSSGRSRARPDCGLSVEARHKQGKHKHEIQEGNGGIPGA